MIVKRKQEEKNEWQSIIFTYEKKVNLKSLKHQFIIH